MFSCCSPVPDGSKHVGSLIKRVSADLRLVVLASVNWWKKPIIHFRCICCIKMVALILMASSMVQSRMIGMSPILPAVPRVATRDLQMNAEFS